MFKMLASAISLLATVQPSSSQTWCPDLSLVLAIDSSSSINNEEFTLQMQGYAAAFANPTVLKALAEAGRVDVAVVMWAGPQEPRHVRMWQSITSDADALVLADWFITSPREINGDTEIGNGLAVALDLLEAHDNCGLRKIINVSGDGRATPGPRSGSPRVTLSAAKARAERLNVTVNGLAITTDEPDLTEYYRSSLITGPGCFVMEVDSFEDFAEAIRLKLKREIEPSLSASLAPLL